MKSRKKIIALLIIFTVSFVASISLITVKEAEACCGRYCYCPGLGCPRWDCPGAGTDCDTMTKACDCGCCGDYGYFPTYACLQEYGMKWFCAYYEGKTAPYYCNYRCRSEPCQLAKYCTLGPVIGIDVGGRVGPIPISITIGRRECDNAGIICGRGVACNGCSHDCNCGEGLDLVWVECDCDFGGCVQCSPTPFPF